ncbi:MAG: response regulator [Chloroflexi bacterium]|nr:response regulator [Chloroflexota bacterium]MCL5108789.1 response regulator [Chloroflexota bacterium]
MAKRIAIVNDDRDFVDMVSLLLEDEGYEVRTCSRGDEALSLLREWRPSLVLLDLRMAGLSGWEALDLIEQDPELPGLRVLITSGAVEEVAARRERLRAKKHDFIALPFDLDRFLGKVKEMAGEPWPTTEEKPDQGA